MTKKAKNIGSNLIVSLIFVVGVALLLYPSLSDKWNSYHASKIISNYQDTVDSMDKAEYEKILSEAKEYNAQIAQHPLDPEMSEEQEEKYNSVLDITGTGIMGYIEIPSINVKLPIYHGTGESALQIATGHLEWTALPVGGDSTHCVISGHRGLPSAKLFSDLDEVNVGDIIKTIVLNETFTYEVDKVTVVLPDRIDSLRSTPGKDYLTVFTCTPYGINTHRLLVRAHRIENIAEEARVYAEADVISFTAVAAVIFVILVILLAAAYFITEKIKNSKKKRRKNEKAD